MQKMARLGARTCRPRLDGSAGCYAAWLNGDCTQPVSLRKSLAQAATMISSVF